MNKRGVGFAALLAATVMVVAAVFFLAALAAGESQVHALQAAGYVPWPGSNLAVDILSLSNQTVWPGASIWIDFVPGQRLGFAFTDLPAVWAITAGAFALAAGAVAARFAWRPNFDGWGAPAGLFCLFTFLGLAAVLQPVMRHGTLGFVIDLSANMITVVNRHDTATLPVTAPMTLASQPISTSCWTTYRFYNKRSYEEGEVTNASGQTATYFLLADTGQADAIEAAVLAFLNSAGQRLE